MARLADSGHEILGLVMSSEGQYSVMMSLVVASALWMELRGAPSRWNKLARTGVVSRTDTAHP